MFGSVLMIACACHPLVADCPIAHRQKIKQCKMTVTVEAQWGASAF